MRRAGHLMGRTDSLAKLALATQCTSRAVDCHVPTRSCRSCSTPTRLMASRAHSVRARASSPSDRLHQLRAVCARGGAAWEGRGCPTSRPLTCALRAVGELLRYRGEDLLRSGGGRLARWSAARRVAAIVRRIAAAESGEPPARPNADPDHRLAFLMLARLAGDRPRADHLCFEPQPIWRICARSGRSLRQA